MNSSKTYRRIAAYLAYALIVVLLIIAFARLIGYFYQGAEENDNPGPEMREDLAAHQPQMKWQPVAENLPGLVDSFLLKDLSQAYRSAWFVSQHIEDTALRIDYLSPNIRLLPVPESQNGFKLKNLDLSHNMLPRLVNLDRQYVAFKDSMAFVASFLVDNENRAHKYLGTSTREYDVSMSLDEGLWRVDQFKQLSYQQREQSTSEVDSSLFEKLKSTKGINYYPAYSPWLDFWPSYNKDTLEKDFGRVKELGLNAVRIFVPYLGRSESEVLDSTSENLESLLDLAEASDLEVTLTLFDFPRSYAIKDMISADWYLRNVIGSLRDSKALVCIDIKNEPDRDFDIHGKSTVLAWLEFMIDRSRLYAPGIPITIGWSDLKSASLLSDKVDIVSCHYYQDWSDFAEQYEILKEKCGNKVILIQEFGRSTKNSFLYPGGVTEYEQREYYEESMEELLSNSKLPFFIWCLYDYSEAPAEVFGIRPWIQDKQTGFGLFSLDGEPKPSAHYLKARLRNAEIPDTSKSVLRNFHITLLISGLLFLVVLVGLYLYFRKT